MPHPEQPSYEQLAARVAELLALVTQQGALIESLQAEVAALRRQAGRDSSNSSQPPSQDGPAATAKAKAGRQGTRRTRTGRSQGGQKGHPGTGLERVAVPDETRVLEPEACAGCGGDLAGAPGQIASSVQVFDLPAIALRVTGYLMMRRSCGCGHVTTAPAPPGVRGGPACYGPNVEAAATLLASADVIGIERAADLMGTLLGAPVSTGFVSACLVRLDDALQAAGFEDALKNALKAADVLGTDETPAPLTTQATGQEGCGNPHVYTVRTMNAYTGGGADLVWYGAAGNRTRPSITGFGILDGFRGVLVRDDYGGYLSYDTQLAGVQQCLAHSTGTSTTPTRSTRRPRRGPGRPVTPCARPQPRSGPPATPAAPASAPSCWPACATATTRPSRPGSPLTCPAGGTKAATRASSWPDGSNARPARSGYSPAASTCPPRITGPKTRSAATSSPRRSAAAGGPWPPCNATAASAPTSPAPATTTGARSTPSAMPSPQPAGCHQHLHDQLAGTPDWLPLDRTHILSP